MLVNFVGKHLDQLLDFLNLSSFQMNENNTFWFDILDRALKTGKNSYLSVS